MFEYFCIGFIDFMLAGKTLNGYTRLFSPYDWKKKMTIQSWVILRMNKDSSVEAIDASKLSDQTKFRLN